MPKSLQLINEQLVSKDPKQRLQGVLSLKEFLQNGETFEPELVGLIVDSLGVNIKDNNFKICQGALSVVRELIDLLNEDFRPHLHTLTPLVIDRLGDTKSSVRDEVQEILQSATRLLTPPNVLDKLLPVFKDRNWRAREQAMICLVATIHNHGSQSFPLVALLDSIVKLLEDPHQNVREAATMCLEEVFREVGEPLRDWIHQQNLRPALVSLIHDRFDSIDARADGYGGNFMCDTPFLKDNNIGKENNINVDRSEPHKNAPSVLKKLEAKKSPKFDRRGSVTVAPIKVVSERELGSEMEEIATSLSSIDNDWSMRLRSLQRLQGLVYGGAVALPSFQTHLLRLKEGLSLQIADLRSAISKEACQTLTALSAALGDAFEPYADTFIDMLLKQTIVTIQVISESANKCIRSILQQTRVNRGIQKFLEGAVGKSGVLRTRCMEYLLLLLRVTPFSALERNVDQIEAVIKSGVSDAVPEVRANARACYLTFAQHWDVRGARLLSSMEPNVRRLIAEEQNKIENSDIDLDMQQVKNSRRPFKNSSSVIARPASSPASQSVSSTVPLTIRAGRPFSSNNLKRAGSDPNLVTGVVPTMPVSTSPPLTTPPNPPGPTFTAHNGQKKINTVPLRMPSSDKESFPPKRLLNFDRGAQRIPMDRATGDDVSLGHQPPSSNDIVQEVQPPAQYQHPQRQLQRPQQHSDQTSLKPSRVLQAAQPLSSALLNPSLQLLQLNTHAQSSLQLHNPPLRIPSRNSSKTQDDARSVDKPLVPQVEVDSEQSGTSEIYPMQDISQLLLDADSPLWSTRAECFVGLRRLFSSKHASEGLSNMGKIMKILVEHLSDPHAKVLSAVLEVLSDIVGQHSQYLIPHLDRLLPQLFARLAVQRDEQRTQSSVILTSLMSTLGGAVLLPVVLRILDTLPTKARIASLEYTVHLIPASQEVLKQQALTRTAITKILSVIGVTVIDGKYKASIPPDLKRAGIQCLKELYNHSKASFVAQVLLLPVNVQLECKKLIGHPSEDFDTSKATVATAEKKEKSSLPREETVMPVEAGRNITTNTQVPPLTLATSKEKGWKGRASTSTHSSNGSGDVSDILATMAAGERKEGLHKCIRLVRDRCDEIWSSAFEQLLVVILESIRDESPAIRELGLIVLREMLKTKASSLLVPFANSTFARVMELFRDTTQREVFQAAEEVCQQAVIVLDPLLCLEIFVSIIREEDGASLQASIRFLSKVVQKLPPSVLSQQLLIILPGLFEAFKNSNADVRKAVVFCLVDIYLILGDNFVPYLSGLSTSQKKLVTIYINRAKSKGSDIPSVLENVLTM